VAAKDEILGLVRKYMDMLGLDIAPHVKVRNNLGSKNLGTTAWVPGETTSTISIQRSVLSDSATLERVVAHEMAHHATFLENAEELRQIVREKGQLARPHVNAYLMMLRREGGHGDRWQKFVDVINRRMGKDFVTERSDETYAKETETKPYYVLVMEISKGRYGFQIGVNLSSSMKQYVDRVARDYGAKIFKVTDPLWQYGPRIGSGKWATSSDKQNDMLKLFGQPSL